MNKQPLPRFSLPAGVCPRCNRYLPLDPARITVGRNVQFAVVKANKGSAALVRGKVIGDFGDGTVNVRFRANKVVRSDKAHLTLLNEPNPFDIARTGICNCPPEKAVARPEPYRPLCCDNCGERMVGDGYSDPMHCPNADTEGFEADCNPIHCSWEDDDEAPK